MRMIVAVAPVRGSGTDPAPGAGLDHDGHHDGARVGRPAVRVGGGAGAATFPSVFAALGRGGQPAAARTPCLSRT